MDSKLHVRRGWKRGFHPSDVGVRSSKLVVVEPSAAGQNEMDVY
jgi:hypothetical protein